MENARPENVDGEQAEWGKHLKRLRLRVGEQWYDVEVGDVYQSPVEVQVNGEPYLVELGEAVGPGHALVQGPKAPKQQPGLRGIVKGNEKVIRCPLPGKVIQVSVRKDQVLEPGDEICVLESMKMEQSVRMAQAGSVKSVKVKKEQSLKSGDPLIELQ